MISVLKQMESVIQLHYCYDSGGDCVSEASTLLLYLRYLCRERTYYVLLKRNLLNYRYCDLGHFERYFFALFLFLVFEMNGDRELLIYCALELCKKFFSVSASRLLHGIISSVTYGIPPVLE